MAVMTVERPLREKLGDDGTNALVKLFDRFEENIKVDVIALSADKYERRLTEEITNIRIDMGLHKSELKGEMVGLRAELKESEERYERRLSEETSKIRVEMAGLRAELKEDIAGLRAELKEDMAGLRADLTVKISSSYASLIKWMFIFWLGQIGAILGILFAFFKS